MITIVETYFNPDIENCVKLLQNPTITYTIPNKELKNLFFSENKTLFGEEYVIYDSAKVIYLLKKKPITYIVRYISKDYKNHLFFDYGKIKNMSEQERSAVGSDTGSKTKDSAKEEILTSAPAFGFAGSNVKGSLSVGRTAALAGSTDLRNCSCNRIFHFDGKTWGT